MVRQRVLNDSDGKMADYWMGKLMVWQGVLNERADIRHGVFCDVSE